VSFAADIQDERQYVIGTAPATTSLPVVSSNESKPVLAVSSKVVERTVNKSPSSSLHLPVSSSSSPVGHRLETESTGSKATQSLNPVLANVFERPSKGGTQHTSASKKMGTPLSAPVGTVLERKPGLPGVPHASNPILGNILERSPKPKSMDEQERDLEMTSVGCIRFL
jgi:hypothetical protein